MQSFNLPILTRSVLLESTHERRTQKEGVGHSRFELPRFTRLPASRALDGDMAGDRNPTVRCTAH